jgi:hypothetical protein
MLHVTIRPNSHWKHAGQPAQYVCKSDSKTPLRCMRQLGNLQRSSVQRMRAINILIVGLQRTKKEKRDKRCITHLDDISHADDAAAQAPVLIALHVAASCPRAQAPRQACSGVRKPCFTAISCRGWHASHSPATSRSSCIQLNPAEQLSVMSRLRPVSH